MLPGNRHGRSDWAARSIANALSCPEDTIILRGLPVALSGDVGRAFISDVARNSEGLTSDEEICTRYSLSAKAWRQLAGNKAVITAVTDERERRVRQGIAAQESAAKIFAGAPTVLGSILHNELASPKHRIDAANALRQAACPETDGVVNPAEKFIINISFGSGNKLVKEFNAPGRAQPDEFVIEGTPNREDQDGEEE
jgi:hypothetical protein